jgi:ubiquinone/menaquinone biosynthesis C-methylase UbiE
MEDERENTNSYIFDPESAAEMARLINQERQLTQAMGGVFTEVPDVAGLRNVLDVACGPGGWTLDVAFAYPQIEVAGIDISRTMIDYANARARTQQLTNASFGVMDITQQLDFPYGAFDMVNARFLFAALHRDAWEPFLQECTRILRPGGILRLTEPLDIGLSNSPALESLSTLLYRGLWRAGYSFSADGNSVGMTQVLPRFLRKVGYEQVSLRGYGLDSSADTDNWADGYRNAQVAYQQLMSLLIKAGGASQEEVEQLYQRMQIEMHDSNYSCIWHYESVTGRKPDA